MKFKVCITESLERVVEVDASDVEEAYEIVYRNYKDGDYILDADDFTGASISILEN